MKFYFIFLFIILLTSCASVPDYEKKNYVKIGNTDPYSLKQTIDFNNAYKMKNFVQEQDKSKSIRRNKDKVHQKQDWTITKHRRLRCVQDRLTGVRFPSVRFLSGSW